MPNIHVSTVLGCTDSVPGKQMFIIIGHPPNVIYISQGAQVDSASIVASQLVDGP